MPRLTPSAILILCVLCVCSVHSPASAQPGHPKNAATWYQKAIDQMDRLTTEEWNTILSGLNEGPGIVATPELRRALAKAAPLIDSYQQAGRQEWADWGLDRSAGIELLLPHLTQVRQIARAVQVSAMVRLHDGDSAGAARLLASAYSATPHLGDDQTLISSLVAQSLFHLADGGVQHAIDRGAIGPNEAAALLQEAKRLASMNDPFNYIGAAVGEQEVIVGWVQEQRNSPDGIENLQGLLINEDGDREFAERMMSMSDEEFDAAVAQYDHVMDRVVNIMQIDDRDLAKAEMAALEAEIHAGEHGPLMYLMPAWTRILAHRLRFEEAIEKRLDELRALALGEAEPEDLANAAIWYLRAFEMIERMEPEGLDLLRRFSVEDEFDAEADEHTPGRSIEPALLLSKDIIDVLHDGSIIRRCDFSIVRANFTPIAPPYAGGMRDGLRMVHADALRLFRAGNLEGAADRLAIAYRMIGHFSGDPHVACSILSHRAFLEAHDLLHVIIADDRLSAEDHKRIAATIERIDAGDVFGYLASRRRALEDLRRAAEQHDRRAEAAQREATAGSPQLARAVAVVEDVAPLPTNVEVVNKADDDAILYFIALLNYFDRPEAERFDEETAGRAEEAEREKWSALHDVLDLEELMATRSEAPLTFGERWRNNSRGALHGLEVRALNALSDRRHRARADLRATVSLLRRSAAPSEAASDP